MSTKDSEGLSLTAGLLRNIYWLPVLYLAFVIVKWLAGYWTAVRKSRNLPGLPFYPIIGNLFDVSLDRESKHLVATAAGFESD